MMNMENGVCEIFMEASEDVEFSQSRGLIVLYVIFIWSRLIAA